MNKFIESKYTTTNRRTRAYGDYGIYNNAIVIYIREQNVVYFLSIIFLQNPNRWFTTYMHTSRPQTYVIIPIVNLVKTIYSMYVHYM